MTASPYATRDPVDFIVVGSGAAGGVVAAELASSGFSIVLLEQGPRLQEKDFTHDEFGVIDQSAIANRQTLQPTTFRESEHQPARLKRAVDYCRVVGGGSVHFTANYWRFHEFDFAARSRWGDVPKASLADWPISYQDLEPYYTRAEQELGVSGEAGANPFDPPRSTPYPLPPLPVKSSGVLFERAARRLGFHPFPAPMAILSKPYRGRMACKHCGFCTSFGCEHGAKSGTNVTTIPRALATGRCDLRPNSYARKIAVDSNRRVRGVVYFDRSRREVLQRGQAVVLCANGAETPRLLLLSRSSQFPHGLANSSGLVGRNLMFDTGAAAFGLFEHPLNDYKSVRVSRQIHDFYTPDPRRGFFGGAAIDARSAGYPIDFALNGLPPEAPGWGESYKSMVAEYFPRTMRLLAHTSCLAQPSNSITLDDRQKDAWGLPALRVTFSPHEDDLKTMRFMRDRLVEILKAARAQKIWTDDVDLDWILPSPHLMGTCRMGKDPSTSVVDSENRSHDVKNLFIVDGSSLVTSGCQQPTATIQALAYRAAERITYLAGRKEI